MKAKIPTIQTVDQTQGRVTYEAFENQLDLCCLARLETDERQIGAYVLNRGDLGDEAKFQIVFAFALTGIHHQLTQEEVAATAAALEEAMKLLLPGERCCFMMGCYADDSDRQGYLSQLVENSPLTLPGILLQNERARVEELTQKGLRCRWEQMVFCTWSADELGEKKTDPLSHLIYSASKGVRFVLDSLTGRLTERQEQFLSRLLLRAYREGFRPWEMLLSTKAGLDIRPLGEGEMWQWLWRRFNRGPAPPIPQLLVLFPDPDLGMRVKEVRSTNFHGSTVLIQGEGGRSSCPEHRQSSSRVYVKDKVCGVMVMAEPVKAWVDQRHQLAWLWEVLSQQHLRDTEVWVELSPSHRFWVEESLHRQAKQSKAARERAVLKGTGRDVRAELKAEESFEAQKKLYRGAMPLSCAVAFLVYREDSHSLDLACDLLAHSFGSAKVVRERHIAAQIWLETLPLTWRRLLHSSSLLSERRLTLENETVAGVLPLTCPQQLDRQGVEFLTEQGGKSTCVDLHGHTQHALVTGMTGSGKSGLLWRFILDALARGIPVVGMDFPAADGESSFRTGIELLGDGGAYIDLSRSAANLLEPPDLRHFQAREREQRLKNWQNFIRDALAIIVMGKVNAPHLAQRVDSILLRALTLFLADADIVERYNLALAGGWKFPAWQNMPVLKDFLRFCTVPRLQIKQPEPIDRQAINQIHSQIEALLASPLGAVLGRPSSVPPEPLLKFYALTGLTNEQDAYIMAVTAQAACVRVALSHQKSLFVGDELSVLCRKEGFSGMLGNLAATARKDGLSLLLSAQDPDTICQSSASAMIMQNMSYRITGKITANACSSFQRYLGYPGEIIGVNASDSFAPKGLVD